MTILVTIWSTIGVLLFISGMIRLNEIKSSASNPEYEWKDLLFYLSLVSFGILTIAVISIGVYIAA